MIDIWWMVMHGDIFLVTWEMAIWWYQLNVGHKRKDICIHWEKGISSWWSLMLQLWIFLFSFRVILHFLFLLCQILVFILLLLLIFSRSSSEYYFIEDIIFLLSSVSEFSFTWSVKGCSCFWFFCQILHHCLYWLQWGSSQAHLVWQIWMWW